MRMKSVLVAAAALTVGALGALSVGAAIAQTGQAAVQSPVIVMDLERLRSQSTAWPDMQQKLKTLVDQKANEFRTQNQAAATQLETEGRALAPLLQGQNPQQIAANPALKTRVEQQIRRENDLKQKQQIFEYSVQATQQRADATLMQALDPIVDQIMTQRGAVIVVDRSQIAKARSTVDITQDAVTRFNAATPRAPQPTWVPVTVGPAPEAAGQPKAAPKK
ncbi:MAG: OmpH family outer membrane protein [Hyphomonadaceae bacterium]|nr:MAG: outer membrane protein [Caulobacteraceae bacterium]MBT9445068.1 OmpH family outer membrane protein [Hyphomonadaceae bacterium]TPW08924.1 MAG: outer membrane protein [Alphaproteobacteria bacterium]